MKTEHTYLVCCGGRLHVASWSANKFWVVTATAQIERERVSSDGP